MQVNPNSKQEKKTFSCEERVYTKNYSRYMNKGSEGNLRDTAD